jgi:hypothetical protein
MNASPAAAVPTPNVFEVERVLRETHRPAFQMPLGALAGVTRQRERSSGPQSA